MPSLADATTRAVLIARAEALTPQSTRVWGKLTAPQMLAHLSDGMRMTYGDLPVASKDMWFTKTALVKWLVIDVMTWPKGTPTAPELLARPCEPWDDERAKLVGLIRRFETEASRRSWPEHPAFGRLSGAQWGRLGWKHLNHHLTQFGV